MKNLNIYIFELIFILFIILLKTILINVLPNIYEIFIIIFLVISTYILYKKYGIKRDTGLVNKNTIQVAIIYLLIYFIFIYLSGLYFGFLKNSYSLNITSIINNTYLYLIMIPLEEIIRYIVTKSSKRTTLPLIILTVIYSILDIILIYNGNIGKESLFIFITTSCLSKISINILCSYIVSNLNILPSIIIRLVLSIYIFIVPIIPDIGNYITSVIGIIYPYLIYISMSKLVEYKSKQKIKNINKNIWYVRVPVLCILISLVILVSGVLRYQIIAIGSGSMEPYMYKGDTVVFDKDIDLNDIDIGDIIVFKANGKYITHRVVEKNNVNNQVVIKTKGDNNSGIDDYQVTEDNIIGLVKFKIKYIGWPTIWFQELIS